MHTPFNERLTIVIEPYLSNDEVRGLVIIKESITTRKVIKNTNMQSAIEIVRGVLAGWEIADELMDEED